MQRHREKDKMEWEIGKFIADEIRFNKNQLWKVTYYGIIIYAGIISIVNIFRDKLVGDFSWYGMFYYTFILLTTSIIIKIVSQLYHNNCELRRYLGSKNNKANRDNKKSLKLHHPDNEQYLGILFIIILGYILSIIYVYMIYGFRYGIFLAILIYLIFEGMIFFYIRKTTRLIDVVIINYTLFLYLYCIHTLSRVFGSFTELNQFLNNLFNFFNNKKAGIARQGWCGVRTLQFLVPKLRLGNPNFSPSSAWAIFLYEQSINRGFSLLAAGAGAAYFLDMDPPGSGAAAMAQIGATGEGTMGYAVVGLKTKILEMYPEIEKMKVIPSLTFDEGKNAYVLKLTKGPHELSTYIDKVDAHRCMDGQVCVSLGVQIRQFLENFKERE